MRALLAGLFRWVLTGLVFTALLGLAYWGHRTDWRFQPQAKSEPATNATAPLFQVEAWPAEQASTLPTWAQGRVRFASYTHLSKAGVQLTSVVREAFRESVPTPGEVHFAPTHQAKLSARVPGVTWRVLKKPGDLVQTGEVLALLDASEVGRAKTELLQALVQLKLKASALATIKNSTLPEPQKREAEAAHREALVRSHGAEQVLSNLGMPVKSAALLDLNYDQLADKLQTLGVPSSAVSGTPLSALPSTLLPITAPLAGTVLACHTLAGETVEPGKVLFLIVDPERLTLTLHVSAEHAPRLQVGQPVRFTPEGSTREWPARLSWLGTSADDKTRKLPVRADLIQADSQPQTGRLRAHTLGKGEIIFKENLQALVVPSTALCRFEERNYVFVLDTTELTPDGPRCLLIREVQVGGEQQDKTEILAGLKLHELVVQDRGARLLQALRSSAQR